MSSGGGSGCAPGVVLGEFRSVPRVRARTENVDAVGAAENAVALDRDPKARKLGLKALGGKPGVGAAETELEANRGSGATLVHGVTSNALSEDRRCRSP